MDNEQLTDRLHKLFPRLSEDSINELAKNEELVRILPSATSAQVTMRYYIATAKYSFRVRVYLPDGQRVFDIQ